MKRCLRLALALLVLSPGLAPNLGPAGEHGGSVLHAQGGKLLRYYWSPWGGLCAGPCPSIRPVLCCRVEIQVI